MSEITLESLAARLTALEQKVAAMNGVIPPSRDWRSGVGISTRSEFTDLCEAEMKAAHDAEQRALDEEFG